jgi:predicted flap endonuclease-1-like 5' DNA nuclease
MQKMFSQMGIPGLGNNAKLNMGAMEAQLNKNMKHAQMKERMRNKAAANSKAKEEQAKTAFCNMSDSPAYSEDELIKIFSTGEKVEKTPRGAKPPLPPNKKKKGKK